MTVDTLKDCNKKVLAQMAKDQGIAGWHAMRKDQLIRALSLPAIRVEEGHREGRGDGEAPDARQGEGPVPARRGGGPPRPSPWR